MDIIKRLIPRELILSYRSLRPLYNKAIRKNMKRRESISMLNLHLADHCNLNCKGCDNFSPLSPKVLADINVLHRDLERLSTLPGSNIESIHLLGGEPLLHPQVSQIIELVKKYFPKAEVQLISNGVLLARQSEDFWQACKTHDVKIIVTKYPIKVDHNAMENLAHSHGVKFDFYGSTRSVEKNMRCVPLDIEGRQDIRESFLLCDRANRCISLEQGRLYTCTLIPYVKYFNSQFNRNLEVSEEDSIDIYKVKDFNEILDFLCRPVPFCRFCNQKGIIQNIGYGVSKKAISEWIG